MGNHQTSCSTLTETLGASARDLFQVVYEDLRQQASVFLNYERPDHTLQPTALVHEAYFRLLRERKIPASKNHFLAIAAIAMRRILINHAAARRADKRGGQWQRITLCDEVLVGPDRTIDLAALNEALDRLEQLEPRQCAIVELRFFGGMNAAEAADVLGISQRTVELDWRMAKAWLFNRLAPGQT